MALTSNGIGTYARRIKTILTLIAEKREEVDRTCDALDDAQKRDLSRIFGEVYAIYGEQGETALTEIVSGLRSVPIGAYSHRPRELLTRVTAYQQANSGEVPDLNTFRKYIKNVFTDQREGILLRTTGPNRMRGDNGYRQSKRLSP